MKTNFIETETNYDKEGHDRTWYIISGADDEDLNGEYGVSTDGSIVDGNGESIDDSMADMDANAIRRILIEAIQRTEAARSMRAVNSPAQQRAARENGRKGGRPKGFIGFEYWDGRNTTTGEPNPDPGTYHGRLSIAGSAKMFRSKKERDEWVSRAQPGKIREAVSRTELRRLMAGYTKQQFDEYMKSLEFDLDVDYDEVNRMIE
jgi:hypothetical protein